MQKSIEARWFFHNSAPSDIISWFQDPMAMVQPLRNDIYLYTPATHNLGIKLREGRIEIKQRLDDMGIQMLHPCVTGKIEYWGKWGFQVNDNDLAVSSLSDSWIAVAKKRIIRRYQVCPNDDLRAVPGWLFPQQRSTLEISDLTICGTSWWSFNIEVVGTNIDLFNALKNTVELVHKKPGLPTLSASDSFSYPQWLDIVIHQNDHCCA